MIQWELRTGRSKVNPKAEEISITVQDGKKGNKMYPFTNISIKKEVWEKKFHLEKQIICGIDGDRIYFKADKRGYSVRTSGSRYRVYLKMPMMHYDFIGAYNLELDKRCGLYYIDKTKKID